MTTANTPVRGVTVNEALDANAHHGQRLELDGERVVAGRTPSPDWSAGVGDLVQVVTAPEEQSLSDRSAASSRSSSPEWRDAEEQQGLAAAAPSASATTTTIASVPQAPVDLTSSWVAAPEPFRARARELNPQAQGWCTIC